MQTFLAKVQETIDKSGSMTAGIMIHRLNQQIKGWTMYHRHAASKRTFTEVDQRIFRMVWHWCRHRHPNKSFTWIKEKYFQVWMHETGSSPEAFAIATDKDRRFSSWKRRR